MTASGKLCCLSCVVLPYLASLGVNCHVSKEKMYCLSSVCLCLCVCTDYLNQNADMFQRTATRLKRKLWWQNVKLWIILIVIILVILIVIIGECL